MNEKIKSLFIAGTFGILLVSYVVLINYWGTQGHEQAHVQDNNYFGASSHANVSIDFSGIHGLTTVDENAQFYSPEDRRAAYLAHAINENIGYQLVPYFNGIMFLLVILIWLIFVINIGGNDNGSGDNRRIETHGKGSNCSGMEQPCP